MRARSMLVSAPRFALAFAFVVLVPKLATAAPVTFSRTDYTTTNVFRKVDLVDIDGDGDLDLLAESPPDGRLTVLLGAGNGSFGAPNDFATGFGAFEFAVADLNGDGFKDVVTANLINNGIYGTTLSVLLGLGNGTFLPQTQYPAGVAPSDVAIGDVTLDGRLDVVVSNYDPPKISVLPGNGDGTLGAPVEYSSFFLTNSVALADLDRDGFLDAVSAINGSNMITVQRGQSDGTFVGGPVTFTGAPSPHGVALGDMDGDGRADVVSANRAGGPPPTTVFVMFGNGNGGGTVAQVTTAADPVSVAVGDVDGDGIPDIAAVSAFVSQICVVLGNGDGTFGPPTTYPAPGTGGFSIALGDVNGDGRNDVATASGANGLSVYRNTSGTPTRVVRVTAGPHGLVAPLGAPLGIVTVPDGGSRSFTITPDAGFEIADVMVDGISLGTPDSYTFSAVSSDHTLEAMFVEGPQPPLQGTLDLKPHKLNLKSKAHWLTAHITPPAPFGADQIDNNSLRLNGVPFAPEFTIHSNPSNTRLTVRFDRQAVMATLIPGHDVPVTLTGTVGDDALPFDAVDLVDVHGAVMHAPEAGQQVAVGADVEVSWVLSPEDPSETITLLSTFDDGATWQIEADGLANSGSYSWRAPDQPLATVRLAVASVLEWDETGPVNTAEYAESGTFSVATPTGVPGGTGLFALTGVAPRPSHGAFTVAFSLPDAAPARLGIFDTSGRRVAEQDVGALGPGVHSIAFGTETRLAPGMYLVRLTRAGRSETARAIVF